MGRPETQELRGGPGSRIATRRSDSRKELVIRAVEDNRRREAQRWLWDATRAAGGYGKKK